MLFFVKRYYKSIVAFFIVLILSVMPAREIDVIPIPSIPHLDKVAHFGMYFMLSIAFILDISKYTYLSTIKTFLISGATAFFVGAGMELIQKYLLSDRTGDIFDMAANTVGIIAGIFFINFASKVEFFRRMF